MTATSCYRLALGLALTTTLVLVWLALGVGLIGADGDRDNRLYVAVVAVGLLGALFARGRPSGLAVTLVAMAAVQALIAAVALGLQLGAPVDSPAKTLLLNGGFTALFVGAAWLFRRAATAAPDAPPPPPAPAAGR